MSEVLIAGRTEELAVSDRFLDEFRDGVSALVFEGEPGIGKTTVWRETVRRAEARGYLVLTARPAASEVQLSFAGLGDLLADVPAATLEHIPGPQRRALEIALLRRRASGPPPGQRTIAVAVHSVLSSLETPCLVAVDDAQWLDQPTSSVLEFVVRRLSSAPVGLLVTVRVNRERPPTFTCGLEERRRRVVRMEGLSLGSLHAVFKDRLGHSFPRPTLMRIASASGGNPFFALEIARELDSREELRPGAELPVPEDLRRLVLAHIRGLPHETREALLAAAALAEPTTDQVDEASLLPAVHADVVRIEDDGRIRFCHPLYSSAVYDATTPARRRDLHARLAGRVGDPEERARHLGLAASRPDEVVARALDDACSQARSRGAVDAAVRLKEEALRLTPAERADARARRGAELGDLRFAAGDTPGAREALQRAVDELPVGPSRSRALALLGMVRWFEGEWRRGIRLAEEALEGVDDPGLRAEIHFRISCVCDWDIPRGAAHARAALELLDADDDPGLYSAALLSLAEWELKAGRGANAAAVAKGIALQKAAEGWQRSHVPAYWARLVDDFSTARARHEEWLQRGLAEQDDPVVCHELMHLGVLALHTGELGRARQLLADALERARQGGDVIFERSALAWGAHVDAHLGRVEMARTSAEKLLADADGYPISEARPRETLGFLALSLGDAAEADRQLTRADDLVLAAGMLEPADHRFQADHIEAVLELGDLDRAATLLDRLSSRRLALPRPWTLAAEARCRGLLQAAEGDLEGAEGSLREALAHHERLGMPFEQARTLLYLGRVLRRRNARKAARLLLGEALEAFDALATPVWSERARDELARIGVRRAPAELTEGERRVAELAAHGLTNREIAAKLFMSRRTVEANLARAYRKLGVRSRAELGARMAVRA